MVEQLDSLWTLIRILVRLFHVLRKTLMAVLSNTSPPSPLLSWKFLSDKPILSLKKTMGASMVSTKTDEISTSEPIPAETVVKTVGAFGGEVSKFGECLPAETRKLKGRPSRIAIPQAGVVGLEFGETFCRKDEDLGREMEVEATGYCLASRRGTRHRMEDGYGIITNIHGDSTQSFFGVFDGHGGMAAMNFVSEKLGKNIISALEGVKEYDDEDKFETAIKAGYMNTDREFLSQGLSSGTCAATVLLRNGELYASNVGDCRVVMSRKGIANVLTSDLRPEREDERIRIESLGGYVSCHNGVWRVQDSLAISRAIGDANMKEWIISEPETRKIQLDRDCEFLVMASDGLWDKVSNQEAVDVVMKHSSSIQSCKDLVEISCSRGNRDDITVMVVDLRVLVQLGS
ncbi:putative protein phosphatase 2C 77 [Platanthera zijinensis]|uniref:protein-serine/threonine phosphatase n=1 Tax=Platanthera zijinensis TaxID=2320716 RepID=A0AAP0AZC9_9ASPA